MNWKKLRVGQDEAALGVMPFEQCCAKTTADGLPGTSVFDHCRYAGAVADGLCRLLPDSVRRLLPVHAGFWVSLHDIGKVSPWFQGKYFLERLKRVSPGWAKRMENNPPRSGDGCDHATVGAVAYVKMATVEKSDPVVKAIARHHGLISFSLRGVSDGPLWQAERRRLVDALAETFGVRLEPGELAGTSDRILAGLVCVADWIASNEDYFPADGKPIPAGELTAVVARVLSAVGFTKTVFRQGLGFGDLFGGFRPRGEQGALVDAVKGPGVYAMEATMGAGKTEAALAAAYAMIAAGSNCGLYFALPTRLTSDRIYLRMQRFLDATLPSGLPVRLSHGRAWLEHYQIGDVAAPLPPWFAPAKRGLLYPFAVGTIDYALFAAMNVRHSFVRLFGLAGKVVILDEVHSYDLYTGSLVKALVRDLREVGCTVIILSATLTKAQRNALLDCETPADAPYPLVTGNADGRPVFVAPRADAAGKRVVLRRMEGAASALADALVAARIGCNVLCVANTVRQAQNWYRLLKAQMNEGDASRLRLGLLHSRFPDFRRNALEADWMEALGKDEPRRSSGAILVSTQIVEQSVDIDADYLITEVAPIDMLLQRMGRLWRHERGQRPIGAATCVLVFDGQMPDLEDFTEEQFLAGIGKGSCRVYAPYVLLRTLRVLAGRMALSIPDDLRPLLEATYAEQAEPLGTAAERFKADLEKKTEEMRGAARAAEGRVTSMPMQDDSEEAPPTRYGSRKTVALLLVTAYDEGIAPNEAVLELLSGARVRVGGFVRDFAVTRALYANTVSVPIGKHLSSLSRESERRLLRSHFHAGEMPLLCRVAEDGRIFRVEENREIGLSYREDFGVFETENAAESEPGGGQDDDRTFDLEGAEW